MSVRVKERLSSTSPCTQPRFHGNVLLVVVGFYCRQAAQQRGLSRVKRGVWWMKLFLNCSAVTAEACWRWTGSGFFFVLLLLSCCSKTCGESSERLVLLDCWVHSAVWELKYFLKLTKTKQMEVALVLESGRKVLKWSTIQMRNSISSCIGHPILLFSIYLERLWTSILYFTHPLVEDANFF